jgi:indolepyruvate ferredoxin oxidoreductase beta subunit
MSDRITNIVIAGLGGQGIITASDILSQAAFVAGHDVKKAEVHGMSQRGGFVTSDVRYGRQVLSPMVPVGDADFLVVFDASQTDSARHMLRHGGRLLPAAAVDPATLPSAKAVNVAMMGLLSAFLDIPESAWQEAILRNLPEKLHEANFKSFEVGRTAGTQLRIEAKNHA